MLISLSLNDELVEQAALREYINMRKREALLELAGRVDYFDDYNPKATRRRK